MNERGHAPMERQTRAEMNAEIFNKKRVLRHRKHMGTQCLPVPAREPRETVRNVLNLYVKRRGVEEIEPSAAQHALPGALGRRAHGTQAAPRTGKRS